MLKIILTDGREFFNDPNLGWNLDSKEEIEENLDAIGHYNLMTREDGEIQLHPNEIKEIRSISEDLKPYKEKNKAENALSEAKKELKAANKNLVSFLVNKSVEEILQLQTEGKLDERTTRLVINGLVNEALDTYNALN
ncbi:hypothetical protein KC480_05695 [Bacillus velezensis]|uniref:hypothetical protein n=1 Tax=Bacillus velezensis TaxID=492670 RepID=UPI001E2B4561|nr:hypothetical protein [Bacillus velezensis]MCD7911017.1 hypothetical protein [Bacillus velezensis]